ncbi:MAG: hypothetical protein LRZ88_06485 [Candidatus Cloacimonetes bacterium]|nr:hypothetical protein [Candidatus Cloacimonadota bacterium]
MDYGIQDYGKEEKVLLEFVSANPTGPLNIVSARAAAFGDTLYRVMKRVGYAPAREFYINDAGNQVDILAESLELRLRELQGDNIGEFPYEAYHGEYVKHLAQKLNATEGIRVFMMTEKDRIERLKDFACLSFWKCSAVPWNALTWSSTAGCQKRLCAPKAWWKKCSPTSPKRIAPMKKTTPSGLPPLSMVTTKIAC